MAFAELSKKWFYQGYPCVILYHEGNEPWTGPYYCGYVGLKEGNPYYGMEYDDIPVYCHGDLTYGRFYMQEGEWSTDEFLDNGYYWIGFDCNHLYDSILSCDLEYVTAGCKQIVDQLVDLQERCELANKTIMWEDMADYGTSE